MANIGTIIDEVQNIADNFTGFGGFTFEELQAVNFDDRAKSYPHLFIDSQNTVDYTYRKIGRDNFPKAKQYTLVFFFMDLYKQEERKTVDKQTKYASLETVADQFISEVIRRGINCNKGFQVLDPATINGFFADHVHNDRLVQLTATITFSVDPDCTLGTFTSGCS